MLTQWLAHPLTRGLNIDDPQTTARRCQIIQTKPFLRRLYEDWYRALAAQLPSGEGPVLELGSGGGFLNAWIPSLITSEIFPCPGVARVVDAQQMPFADASLRAIVMIDVLHHVPKLRLFFAEARRCLQEGGAVVMIEPWVTPWARWVYTHLHHEPFDPAAATWEIPSTGPLSGANGALPWIVFMRDRDRFVSEFPEFAIKRIEPIMPLRYLLSGGVSLRSLMPGWSYGAWRRVETWLRPWNDALAMFALIVLVKRGS